MAWVPSTELAFGIKMPKDCVGEKSNRERSRGEAGKKEERRNGCWRPSVCQVPHMSGETEARSQRA